MAPSQPSSPTGAVLALALGAIEALGASASGHAAVGRFVLDLDAGGAALGPWARLGAAAGLCVAARGRAGRSLAEGFRGVARPAGLGRSPEGRDAVAIALATLAAVPVAIALAPLLGAWERTPVAVGSGLVASGLVLGATALAKPGAREGPGPLGALVLGAAYALAGFPGGSPVGIATAMLAWQGVRPARAADLALIVVAPGLAASAIAQIVSGNRPASATAAFQTLVLALIAAAAGGTLTRKLVERGRMAWIAPWLLAIGLATLAYAHASG